MSDPDRKRLAREAYDAYVTGDRAAIERLLSDDFTFFSPADVGIDRVRYFERCWPNADVIRAYELLRVVEAGEEVLVTYAAVRKDGSRFRNTEVLTFAGEKLSRVEVYFGWNLG
jgi:ketosteroid isomerase-like protein